MNLRNARGFSDNIPNVNTARMGNEITAKRLYPIAPRRLPSNSDARALSVPHPGQ